MTSGQWMVDAWRELSCPEGPHRGPQGPNEDIAVCQTCGSPTYEMRTAGETFGWHADDCSLPVRHESYCEGGGAGHPPAPVIRGYWPDDPRSVDFRGDS